MLQNAYLLAKIGADTAENEQHFAEILPTIGKISAARHAEERLESLEKLKGLRSMADCDLHR